MGRWREDGKWIRPEAIGVPFFTMTIPSRKLMSYFPSMVFPANVLFEDSDKVAKVVSQIEMLALIAREQVFGTGTWKRIKKFRLNCPVEDSVIAPAGLKLESHVESSGSVLARTAMGAYRERLNQVFCSDSTLDRHDHRVVVGEGEQQGWCFTFCGQGSRGASGTLGVSARKPDLEQLDAIS